MIRRYIIIICILTNLATSYAQEHTTLLNLSLEMSPDELVDGLIGKGMQQEDVYELSGRISGLDVWVYVNVSRDSATVNHVLVTTQEQQGVSLREDYAVLRKWMQKHYGAPTWEATVRSYPFARWYIGYDHDIVLIATASSGIELWFYENHKVRNIDYYSILKYCERNPAPGLPLMTAQEQVTWKSTGGTSVVRKKVAKRRHVRKATKHKRRSKTSRSKKRRRRR